MEKVSSPNPVTLQIPLNPMAFFTALSFDFEATEKTSEDFPSNLD